MNVRSGLAEMVPSEWRAQLYVSLRVEDPDGWRVIAGLRGAQPPDGEVYTSNHLDERSLIYTLSRVSGRGSLANLLEHSARDALQHTLRHFTLRRYLTADLGFALFAADNDTDPEHPFPADAMREMWRVENTQAIYSERAGSVLWWAEKGAR